MQLQQPRRGTLSLSLACISIGMSLCLLCLSSSLKAQEGLNKIYDNGYTARYHSIVNNDSHLFVSGVYKQTSTSFQSGFVARLDTFGNIMWWADISDDSSSLIVNAESNMVLTNDGLIAVHIGYIHRPSIGFALFDLDGYELLRTEYPQPGMTVNPQSVGVFENGYIITGWIAHALESITDAFILRIDNSGKVLWQERHGEEFATERPRGVLGTSFGQILMYGLRARPDPPRALGSIVAFDSLGQQLWEWEADSLGMCGSSVLSMHFDSTLAEFQYVTAHSRPTMFPDENYTVSAPVFVRKDSEGLNDLSCQVLGPYAVDSYLACIIPSRFGGWIAAGRTSMTTDDYVSPVNSASGRIVRISENDSVLWEAVDTAFFHPEQGSNSYLSSVTETSSGSIYAAGWANGLDSAGQYRSFGWLIRVTKDGCIDTLCGTTSTQIPKADPVSISVSPNPFVDMVTYDLSELDLTDLTMVIRDINGQVVRQRRIETGSDNVSLDLSDLAASTYVYQVLHKARTIATGKLVKVE